MCTHFSSIFFCFALHYTTNIINIIHEIVFIMEPFELESQKLPAWAVPSRAYARGCQRWLRISIFSALTLAIIILLGLRSSHHERLPFEYFPQGPPMVHSKLVSEWQKEFPLDGPPLDPFTQSPKEGSPIYEKYDGRYLPWLAAVVIAPGDQKRREMIRSSWMELYRDVPFDGRFVIGNPTGELRESIMAENRTHGDIIVLDDLRPNGFFANSIKTLELYKWLVRNNKHYDFVSKIDSDAFLNARKFWDQYLEPRLPEYRKHQQPTSEVMNTVIGSITYSAYSDAAFTQGSFYTCSWDMVETFAKLQDDHNVVIAEDVALSILLHKGKTTSRIVHLGSAESYNYDERDTRGDGTAWARPETHLHSQDHAVYGAETVLVHKVKDDDKFLRVADCFDSSGVKERPPFTESDRQTALPFSYRWFDFWYNMGISYIYHSRLDDVPAHYWQLKDGDWWIQDIWNFGPHR